MASAAGVTKVKARTGRYRTDRRFCVSDISLHNPVRDIANPQAKHPIKKAAEDCGEPSLSARINGKSETQVPERLGKAKDDGTWQEVVSQMAISIHFFVSDFPGLTIWEVAKMLLAKQKPCRISWYWLPKSSGLSRSISGKNMHDS